MVARLFGNEGLHCSFRNWVEKELKKAKSDSALSSLLGQIFSGGQSYSRTPSSTSSVAVVSSPRNDSHRALQRAYTRLGNNFTRLSAENERLTVENESQAAQIREMFSLDRERAVALAGQLVGIERGCAHQVNLSAAELFACERKLRTAARLNSASGTRKKKLLDGMTRRHKVALFRARREFNSGGILP
jgi:hypothetical protein